MKKIRIKTVILSLIAILLTAIIIFGIILLCSPKFEKLIFLKSTVDNIKSNGTYQAEIINLDDESVKMINGSHNGLNEINGMLNDSIEFYYSPDRGLIVNVTDVVRDYTENSESVYVQLISHLLNKDIWVKYSDLASIASTDGSENALNDTMDYVNELKEVGVNDLDLIDSNLLSEDIVFETGSGIQIGINSNDEYHISIYIPDMFIVHADFDDTDTSIEEPDDELSEREVQIISTIYDSVQSIRGN